MPLKQKKAKTMEQESDETLLSLNTNMDNNFAKIHQELSCLHLEMKDELDKLNGRFHELEKDR